ncbi:hypothetical protein C7M84_021141 [Penaeus vannamei]|uniref:Uncharacterized protein n=1 Tax=Penaeus vannamei TaxID=6689 RepID=A0A3R7NEM2_PENVA|nr:hypothetical protein C7M84_021141 [Penaeus vannamei]
MTEQFIISFTFFFFSSPLPPPSPFVHHFIPVPLIYLLPFLLPSPPPLLLPFIHPSLSSTPYSPTRHHAPIPPLLPPTPSPTPSPTPHPTPTVLTLRSKIALFPLAKQRSFCDLQCVEDIYIASVCICNLPAACCGEELLFGLLKQVQGAGDIWGLSPSPPFLRSCFPAFRLLKQRWQGDFWGRSLSLFPPFLPCFLLSAFKQRCSPPPLFSSCSCFTTTPPYFPCPSRRKFFSCSCSSRCAFFRPLLLRSFFFFSIASAPTSSFCPANRPKSDSPCTVPPPIPAIPPPLPNLLPPPRTQPLLALPSPLLHAPHILPVRPTPLLPSTSIPYLLPVFLAFRHPSFYRILFPVFPIPPCSPIPPFPHSLLSLFPLLCLDRSSCLGSFPSLFRAPLVFLLPIPSPSLLLILPVAFLLLHPPRPCRRTIAMQYLRLNFARADKSQARWSCASLLTIPLPPPPPAPATERPPPPPPTPHGKLGFGTGARRDRWRRWWS